MSTQQSKTTAIILNVVLFAASLQIIYSAPVSLRQAETAANTFLSARYPSVPQAGLLQTPHLTIRQMDAWTIDDRTIGFIAQLFPAGYVLMRTDDEIPPIKIYSDQGAFSNLPPNFANAIALELMEELQGIHQFQTKGNAVDPKYHHQWEALLNGTTRSLSSGESFVSSAGTCLLSTTWNQDDPYNYYAPGASGGPGGRALAGCVAVAMAQIIRYHQNPVKIAMDHTYTDESGSCQGTHSIHDAGITDYAYQNMSDYISTDSSVAQKQAVGQLMYHCAAAVDMNFDAGASGAGVNKVGPAFCEYFNYQANAYALYADCSRSEWYQKIKADIDNNCPVFYGIYSDAGGHAVVCDGYADGNTIHLNLGWSGAYDAWYNMESVIAQEYTSHGAVFGIQANLPEPCIYINDMRGDVSLSSSDEVRIDISLKANGYAGINQDWWLVISTPFGWYYLNSIRQFVSSPPWSLSPAYQGPIGDISYYRLPSLPSLPLGIYTFYFGLDTMNGILDSSVVYDVATLTVIISAPTGISASDGTYTDKVRVTWNAVSESTSYEVWRNTADNSGSATKLTDTTSTSYNDSNTTAFVSYYYWIKAKNSVGTSGFSSSDSGYRRSEVIGWGSILNYNASDVPVEAQSGVSAIAAGYSHGMALKDGKVIVWGVNYVGQCNVPEEALTGVSAIASGLKYCLALKDGKVIAWGDESPEAQGVCDVPVEAQSGVSAIAGGGRHGMALKNGKVIAWGYNENGQCNVPEEAQSGVSAIAGGGYHSMALKDGKVITWGGYSLWIDDVPVKAQSGVSAIAGGEEHCLALNNGRVIAWGDNSRSACNVPGEAMIRVSAIAAGRGFSLALRDGKVIAWGDNEYSQCNMPEEAQTGVSAIACGYYHSLAIRP